jgi:hypothetical protein
MHPCCRAAVRFAEGNERRHDHRRELRRHVLVSPAQGRVNGCRPDGGQHATVENSDTVVTLSPTAERMPSIAALRSGQLIWKEQQDF